MKQTHEFIFSPEERKTYQEDVQLFMIIRWKFEEWEMKYIYVADLSILRFI
jgi:hypothetical protein